MVTSILKMYFIGTALTVLAVLFGIVDSVGGLMYVQDCPDFLELDRRATTRRWVPSSSHQRGAPLTKRIGS